MPSYSVRALVLRKRKLGEGDSIVVLLSSEGRQIRAVAKSARKSASRLRGRVEPFNVIDALLHTGRDLEIVGEAESVQVHEELGRDYDRSVAASVVTDVMERVSLEGEGDDERLYGLAVATLETLNAVPVESLPSVVAAFVVKALAMLGLRPTLAKCARCDEEVPGDAWFSPAAGGVTCERCFGQDADAVRMAHQCRQDMADLLRATLAEVPALQLSPERAARCLFALRSFAAYHLPARMRALEFYLSQASAGS